MNKLVTLVTTLRFKLDTEQILSSFILEEISLELNNYAKQQEHIKKIYNKPDSYLLNIVYVKESFLDTEEKKKNYYRASLILAIREFSRFIGNINIDDIIPFKEHILSYIFDIQPLFDFFEKPHNNDFVLFGGIRNYYTTSQEIRLASCSLFWQSPENSVLDQKIAFNLAIFTLRQSLELRFKRICGIFKINSNNYLKHDFFIEFIKKNNGHFDFPDNCSLCEIWKIYQWTNSIVHSGNRPNIWEIQFALEFTRPLFSGGEYKKDNQIILSVFGAVKIKDFDNMKNKLNQEICEKLKIDISDVEWLENPEAIVE
jgi:hypothetical protein